jgi:hypothetical protein
MALKKYIELDTGIILQEAYIRITEGILSLDRKVMFITVETYADKHARDGGKIPVFRKEFKADMSGSQPRVDASYKLNLNNSKPAQNLKLVIDVNSDAQIEFELIEGTHITTDGTLGTLTHAVVDKMNSNVDFNTLFVAMSDIEGKISINAIGDNLGTKGNELLISGSMVNSFAIESVGQDNVLSNFEKYFLFDLMNQVGKNLILLAYEFIKHLPEYEGSVDII